VPVSTFESRVSAVAGDVASGLTGGAQAQAQLKTALQQLANGFQAAFKPVGC
jgi:hypothetical protein